MNDQQVAQALHDLHTGLLIRWTILGYYGVITMIFTVILVKLARNCRRQSEFLEIARVWTDHMQGVEQSGKTTMRELANDIRRDVESESKARDSAARDDASRIRPPPLQ